jgi:hypothetical protein
LIRARRSTLPPSVRGSAGTSVNFLGSVLPGSRAESHFLIWLELTSPTGTAKAAMGARDERGRVVVRHEGDKAAGRYRVVDTLADDLGSFGYF